MSCFTCFSWLSPQTPPESRGGRVRPQVGSMHEAMRLERTGSCAWASPAPRRDASAGAVSGVVAPANSRLQPSQKDFEVGGPTKSTPGVFGVEQLLASPGTLPKGLPSAERERVLRSVEPTSTFDLLAQVPMHMLTQEGPEGQQLRRKMLSGATIVYFTAGYEGKRFVYERAAELGVKVVLIESPDSWSRTLLDEGVIAKFIPIDMTQSSSEIYNQALAAMKDLKNDPAVGEADGITTVVELSIATVARLAEQLGLPGPLPESVDIARDKKRTRGALAAAGLPTPANYLITEQDQLPAAAAHVGFPAVLKPISGAASLGVKKVVSYEDLQASFLEVDSELRSLVVMSGALVKDDGSGNGVKADGVVDTSLILEAYLDGDEVDVDVVMSGGDWRYAAVTDNGPTLEPYFNETWAVTPSMLPKIKQQALKQLAIDSVKALGFQDGVFHVECKYTSSGPHLIEVNARMGGGPVRLTNLLVWDVDLVEEGLFCSVGIPCRPAVTKEPLTCIANCDVNTMTSGILEDDAHLEILRSRDDIVSFSPHVEVGSKLVAKEDGMPTWIVEIVIGKPTPREAYDCLMGIEAEVQAAVNVAPVEAIDSGASPTDPLMEVADLIAEV